MGQWAAITNALVTAVNAGVSGSDLTAIEANVTALASNVDSVVVDVSDLSDTVNALSNDVSNVVSTSIAANATSVLSITSEGALGLKSQSANTLFGLSAAGVPSFLSMTAGILGSATRTPATIYVSPSGLDTNDGSAAFPYLTLAAVSARIQSASVPAGPVVVNLAPGTYAMPDATFGVATKMAYFICDGRATVNIDPTGVRYIYAAGAKGVTFAHIGTGTAAYFTGEISGYAPFEDCVFTKTTNAIIFAFTYTANATGVVFVRSVFSSTPVTISGGTFAVAIDCTVIDGTLRARLMTGTRIIQSTADVIIGQSGSIVVAPQVISTNGGSVQIYGSILSDMYSTGEADDSELSLLVDNILNCNMEWDALGSSMTGSTGPRSIKNSRLVSRKWNKRANSKAAVVFIHDCADDVDITGSFIRSEGVFHEPIGGSDQDVIFNIFRYASPGVLRVTGCHISGTTIGICNSHPSLSVDPDRNTYDQDLILVGNTFSFIREAATDEPADRNACVLNYARGKFISTNNYYEIDTQASTNYTNGHGCIGVGVDLSGGTMDLVSSNDTFSGIFTSTAVTDGKGILNFKNSGSNALTARICNPTIIACTNATNMFHGLGSPQVTFQGHITTASSVSFQNAPAFGYTYSGDTLVFSNTSAVRSSLGLGIGSNVQAWDSDLDAIAALSTTAFGRGLLANTDASAVQSALGLVIGANVQAWDSDLNAIAALTTTSFGRGLLSNADASALRTTAEIGTLGIQNANNVAITGGTFSATGSTARISVTSNSASNAAMTVQNYSGGVPASFLTSGAPPFSVNSSNLVSNLNVQYLGGLAVGSFQGVKKIVITVSGSRVLSNTESGSIVNMESGTSAELPAVAGNEGAHFRFHAQDQSCVVSIPGSGAAGIFVDPMGSVFSSAIQSTSGATVFAVLDVWCDGSNWNIFYHSGNWADV